METILIAAVKILIKIGLMLVSSAILELLLTGSITYTPLDFIMEFLEGLLELPLVIFDAILCVAFQIIDFIIEVLWDLIPGLSDVFSAPSASDLFSAC